LKSVVYLGCPATERLETEKSLAAASLSVVWADNVAYALTELSRNDMPVLLDLSRGTAALQNARELRTQRAATLMFAVVDARRPELTTEAVLAGVADVFARPLGGRRVASAIERELAPRNGTGAAAAQHAPLYCHSPAMQEVLALVARAAAMRAGVMVAGEAGTGRQMVARAIHTVQTPAAPFIAIDFASLDADEIDGALFGSVAGQAKTPGDARGLERISRKSLVFQARGGTLYFQNVAEAPTRVQGRLARVLRDREAVVVETGEPLALDVRPMASVDPGIDRIVQEGRVRDDLFRRLSVIRIEMPPLRSRREDIPALANYFVREICAARREGAKMLSRAALSLVGALPWRGNADELRTLLEGAIAGQAESVRTVGIEDVLTHVRLDGGSVVFANGGTLRQARARFEREYITAVLEQHHGRITDAAKTLGIQRTNLYRKMRSLRVNRRKH
jgi:DNA-binding NtrC family response regulator